MENDGAKREEGRESGAGPSDHQQKYKVENVVGKGGMGIVYSARDLNFQRLVAMKVLAGDKKPGEEDVVHFVEEAQITSQLEHPNIIPVHEMGRDTDGNVFYTMKYVNGVTLTDILNDLRKGDRAAIDQYPLGRLLTIFQKTCDAVAFAHSRGVVHHDLKPGNIMIGDYGEVLVLDWGLAKVLKKQVVKTSLEVPILAGERVSSAVTLPEWSVQDAAENKTLVVDDFSVDSIHTDRIGTAFRTVHGRILGTPAFMAPEQVQPSEGGINERTDVYSLGGVLYSILTLRPPISAENLSEVLRKILSNEILPPVEFNLPDNPRATVSGKNALFDLPHCPGGRIPRALSDIAMKALAGRPEERYRSVRELQRDVEAYQDGQVWNLVMDEDFSSPDVLARWEICGHYEWREGELRLYGGEPQFLLLKKPLAGDVRIEFECRMESPDLTDLGCFLSSIRSDHMQEIPPSGYQFKYGGYSNSVNVVERSDSKLWSQPASPLARGRTYAVRAERVGDRLRLLVNGEEVVSVADDNPLSGADRTAVGLLGSMTDTRYTRVRVYCLGTPWRADLLDVAERHLQNGHYLTAMDLFREVLDAFPDADRRARAEKGYVAARNRDHMLKNLPLWKEQLSKAWPGLHVTVRMDNDGLTVDVTGTGISDLEPLRGMPLIALYCSNNNIASLEPLRGMPLVTLNCGGNPIASLDPLRGMPLATLLCEGCPIESLEPLRGAPLTMLNCGGARLAGGLEPLRGMPLTWLCCWHSGVESLEPLRGMPLTALYCDGNQIASLEPLAGMALSRLICSGNRVATLEPLRGMPLTTLHCAGNKIESLDPLRGMPLNMLSCQCNDIASLEPLKGTSLGVLTCGCNRLASIGSFVKSPPETFIFDCDAIPLQELEWMQQLWTRDFRLSQHAKNAETLMALRTSDVERLRRLASEFQGHRYLFVPKFMRWRDARELCEKLGGHLVTISSKEENDFITTLKPGGNWFWLGLETTEAGHRWVTGEPFIFGTFVDALREKMLGEKVFCSGTITAEVYTGVSNCFVIEWDQ